VAKRFRSRLHACGKWVLSQTSQAITHTTAMATHPRHASSTGDGHKADWLSSNECSVLGRNQRRHEGKASGHGRLFRWVVKEDVRGKSRRLHRTCRPTRRANRSVEATRNDMFHSGSATSGHREPVSSNVRYHSQTVHDKNFVVQTPYKSIGFQPEGEQVGAWRIGDRYFNMLAMARLGNA